MLSIILYILFAILILLAVIELLTSVFKKDSKSKRT